MSRPERPRRIRNTSRELQEAAVTLRHEMTPAELALWAFLRRRQLDGLHFRRQHPVGRFVLDFYCASARLVVDVDGGVHDEHAQQQRDCERTRILNQHGLRVLRVSNEQVLSEMPGALEKIRAACTEEMGEE